MYATGDLSKEAFLQADGDLKAQISGLEDRRRELAGMTRLDAILGDPAQKLEDRWRAMPVSARRKVLGILFTAEHMGQPYLMPEPPGAKPGSVPVADRLSWGAPAEVPAEEPVPDGFKRCNRCREVLPLDAEHLYQTKSTRKDGTAWHGFEGKCRTCRNVKHAEVQRSRYPARRKDAGEVSPS